MVLRVGISLVLTLSALVAADTNGSAYMALGDSIAFGFDPALLGNPASSFTGYPEVLVSNSRQLKKVGTVLNVSCPGESSGSFLDASKPDFHCRDYKAGLDLHVPYQGTQMSEALFLLRNNTNIGLITINIGGNDLVLLQLGCKLDTSCILAGLPAVLNAYAENLATILNMLRQDAKYTGTIVLLTQYSPNYQDVLQTGAVSAMNSVAITVASNFGVLIADGFGAFQQVAAKKNSGGDSCAAGLLVMMPSGVCDVHPSAKGERTLANAINAVFE